MEKTPENRTWSAGYRQAVLDIACALRIRAEHGRSGLDMLQMADMLLDVAREETP